MTEPGDIFDELVNAEANFEDLCASLSLAWQLLHPLLPGCAGLFLEVARAAEIESEVYDGLGTDHEF